MNIFTKTLFCFLIITLNVLPQDKEDSLTSSSSAIKLSENIFSILDDLDFYLDLHNLDKSLLTNADPNTAWLWTSYAITNSQNEFNKSDGNFASMTSPLYQKYLNDSKFNPFRYALGMIQTGAAGYLAYRHLKKYGFLKK